MSLNRYERILMDYLENHAEEKRYWEARVLEIDRRRAPRIQGARFEQLALGIF